MKPHLTLSLAIAGALALAACSAQETHAPAEPPVATDAAPDAMAPAAPTPAAPANPSVGGAAMDANLDIVANAAAAPNLSTLVAAVKASDLVATLQGPGPFTVFAPTDDAFAKLPAGTVDGLLQPGKKADLAGLLTYHVVSGSVDAATLLQQIDAGGGSARLTTVQGATLTATPDGAGGITLTDAKGGTAKVTTADVRQSNGVVHVIDSVLMP